MANINDYGFPFSSISNDRQYSAAEWREYFGTLIKDGIVQNSLNECQVKPQSSPNKTVFVDTGTVFIKGAMRILGTTQTLSIDDNTSGNPRIDRIVARLNFTDRKIEFAVLKGTPAANPLAIPLTRNTSVWELAIADVTLSNGFSTIVGTAIADKRPDTNLCGASSVTIGVIPPSGMDAETVMLSTATATDFDCLNVDQALSKIASAQTYGKVSQMSFSGSLSVSGIVPFTNEDFDDWSCIDLSSNYRITIPVGLTRVRFFGKASLNGSYQGSAPRIKLYKNGLSIMDLVGTEIPGSSSDASTQISAFDSGYLSVSEGDYFELYYQKPSYGSASAIVFGMEA